MHFIFTDYRVCEFGGNDCVKTPSVEDKTVHKYGARLIERVGTVYNNLKKSCQLPELPPAPTKAPPTRIRQLRIKNNTKIASDVTQTKETSSYTDKITP